MGIAFKSQMDAFIGISKVGGILLKKQNAIFVFLGLSMLNHGYSAEAAKTGATIEGTTGQVMTDTGKWIGAAGDMISKSRFGADLASNNDTLIREAWTAAKGTGISALALAVWVRSGDTLAKNYLSAFKKVQNMKATIQANATSLAGLEAEIKKLTDGKPLSQLTKADSKELTRLTNKSLAIGEQNTALTRSLSRADDTLDDAIRALARSKKHSAKLGIDRSTATAVLGEENEKAIQTLKAMNGRKVAGLVVGGLALYGTVEVISDMVFIWNDKDPGLGFHVIRFAEDKGDRDTIIEQFSSVANNAEDKGVKLFNTDADFLNKTLLPDGHKLPKLKKETDS